MKPKQNKPWLYQRKFVVPQVLLDRIKSLPEKEQIKYCRIINKIVILGKDDPFFFQNIGRKYFLDGIGSDYALYLNNLEQWNIMETNTNSRGKASYRNGIGIHFTKSFRLTNYANLTPLVKVVFQKQGGHPRKDKSTLIDPVTHFVYSNLQRLTVPDELAPQQNLIDEVESEEWAESIYYKQFNLHYGKTVSRLYHSVINMPSLSRKNLILADSPSTPLYEFDIKSCHPVLLLTMVTDPAERQAYMALLDKDIYSTISKQAGCEAGREDQKLAFMQFVNGQAKNYYHAYFKKHFPQLLSRIESSGKDMASIAQNSEAQIMVKQLPQRLLDKNVFFVPMHDGWLGIEEDETTIAKEVCELFYAVTGYHVSITRKNIRTGEETTLIKGINSPQQEHG